MFGHTTSRSTNLLEFYRSHDPKPDGYGRTLNTILNWSDTRLEDVHNYIQILFPLPEASMVAWDAPIITPQIYDAFNENGGQAALHRNLQRSFVRIMSFYGFTVVGAETLTPRARQALTTRIKAEWADNHQERFSNWIRGGHNNLRITRIIRCLRVLGRHDLAEFMLDAIQSVWDSLEYRKRCDQSAMEWWLKAYEWPLYSPPSGREGEVGAGLQWLKDKIDAQEAAGLSAV